MKTVEALADEIIGREGGFVNDPDDPGGATKFGLSLSTARDLGLDLDGDGDVDRRDIGQLTRDQVRKVFVAQYFDKPRLGLLPDILQPAVFDMYVNSGAQAVRILQKLLVAMGFDLAVDGVVGPITAEAAGRAAKAAPEHLPDAYAIARRNYYYALAKARPASRKYAVRRDGGKGGWITRAEEFMAPQYRLSEAEHRAVVSQWH